MTEQSLYEAPVVEIAGEEYEMRRLGIKDLKSLWGIIQTALGEGLSKEDIQQLQEEEDSVEDVGMEVLINTVPVMTDQISEWCAGILKGFDKEDIDDPEKFPVYAPLKIINVLGEEHQDFERFFTEAGQATQVLKKMGKNLSLT